MSKSTPRAGSDLNGFRQSPGARDMDSIPPTGTASVSPAATWLNDYGSPSRLELLVGRPGGQHACNLAVSPAIRATLWPTVFVPRRTGGCHGLSCGHTLYCVVDLMYGSGIQQLIDDGLV